MIKDKNSINEAYKNYAFVEFFELENAKKALEALNKGEISLRKEVLSGNYSTKSEDKKNNNEYINNFHVNIYFFIFKFFILQNDKLKDINLNYLDNEQKKKMEKILSLQNNIEALKEKQEERISSYDDYYNNNATNKVEEELKMKKMQMLKMQRDKKKKLEKKMNNWAQHQEKISEIRIQNYEKKKNKEINNNNDKEKEDDNEEDNNNNNYNEEFDISKYNVISLDNLQNNEENKEDNNNKNNNDNNDEGKKKEINTINEFICMICQRKFASAEKLALHEKLSELHKQNLNKLKLNNN